MTRPDPHPWFPRHPRLQPGLVTLRHDDGRWQLGVERDDRLLLPADPDADSLVRCLRAEQRPDLAVPGVRRWAHELVARGLVVDAGDVARALERGPGRDAVLSAFTRPDAAIRLEARATARLRLEGGARWREQVTELAGLSGIELVAGTRPADLTLVIGHRWLAREMLDPLVRDGLPHLVVRHDATSVEVGPFVLPGLSACLRCSDGHRATLDPGHATVLALAPAPDAEDPVDPLLLRLGLAWAVRDLVAYVEGDEPSTWSASVRLDHRLGATRTPWTRHPACGCAWGDRLAVG